MGSKERYLGYNAPSYSSYHQQMTTTLSDAQAGKEDDAWTIYGFNRVHLLNLFQRLYVDLALNWFKLGGKNEGSARSAWSRDLATWLDVPSMPSMTTEDTISWENQYFSFLLPDDLDAVSGRPSRPVSFDAASGEVRAMGLDKAWEDMSEEERAESEERCDRWKAGKVVVHRALVVGYLVSALHGNIIPFSTLRLHADQRRDKQIYIFLPAHYPEKQLLAVRLPLNTVVVDIEQQSRLFSGKIAPSDVVCFRKSWQPPPKVGGKRVREPASTLKVEMTTTADETLKGPVGVESSGAVDDASLKKAARVKGRKRAKKADGEKGVKKG